MDRDASFPPLSGRPVDRTQDRPTPACPSAGWAAPARGFVRQRVQTVALQSIPKGAREAIIISMAPHPAHHLQPSPYLTK
jgi:hypothetical protein